MPVVFVVFDWVVVGSTESDARGLAGSARDGIVCAHWIVEPGVPHAETPSRCERPDADDS